MNSPAPSAPDSAETPPAPVRLNWMLFFTVLLAPTLLTSAIIFLGAKRGDAAPTVAVVGAGLSGIWCGVMLGRFLGRSPALKVLFSIVFALVLIAVCIAMNCFGCLVSGYQLNFH